MNLTEKQINSFWDRVNKAGEDECWNWTGYTQATGYGYVTFGGKKNRRQYRVARLSYILANGEIDNNTCVMHTCKNKSCVNPKHLCIGTRQDVRNHADINYKCKMTAEDIQKAKELYDTGMYTYVTLGKRYGVSGGHLSKLINRL